jgi:hypothetical protein
MHNVRARRHPGTGDCPMRHCRDRPALCYDRLVSRVRLFGVAINANEVPPVEVVEAVVNRSLSLLAELREVELQLRGLLDQLSTMQSIQRTGSRASDTPISRSGSSPQSRSMAWVHRG